MITSRDIYDLWLSKSQAFPSLKEELLAMSNDDDLIEEHFYRQLTFGTSGIRGKMGPGTNRMNLPVVGRATQGLSNYLKKNYTAPKVGIAYDSRINSRNFALHTAKVLCANDIDVYMFEELSPVPSLSFAIRDMGLDLGVMITASHNPKEYNGYKVYDKEGCQIVGDMPGDIYDEIEKVDYFDDVKMVEVDGHPRFHFVPQEVSERFVQAGYDISLPGGGEEDLKIVYSPLCGAGNRYVRAALAKGGFKNITVVASQEMPDGTFKTCPFPNPEREEVYAEAIKTCDKVGGDLIIVTDPDSDRVGVCVATDDGYWNPTGNQIGILLFDYICKMKDVKGKAMERSIVTTPLVDEIAKAKGVDLWTCLIGFKYIGKDMDEMNGRFIFGFEEGVGYLAGYHVRDKDGVSSALLIAQMTAYYKAMGKNLSQAMHEIYEQYGYSREEQLTFTFEGKAGASRMVEIMEELRKEPDLFGEECRILDYKDGLGKLPKSNVLEFIISDNEKVIIRPSGTEPKIKCYFIARGANKDEVRGMLDDSMARVKTLLG